MELASVLGMTAIAVALLIGMGALGTAIGFGILGSIPRRRSSPARDDPNPSGEDVYCCWSS